MTIKSCHPELVSGSLSKKSIDSEHPAQNQDFSRGFQNDKIWERAK
jgi:hypothetical protein